MAQLSRKLTVTYGMGALGNGVFVTVPGLLLLYYLTNILGVGAGVASAVLFVPKFWDAFANPLMGGISDRSTNRFGKRRPFMLVGGLGTALAFVLLFSAPRFSSTTVTALYVSAVFTVAMTLYAVFCVPWSAMPPEMTDDYHERTRITSVRMVLLTVGILVGGALAPTIAGAGDDGSGGTRSSYALMSVVVGSILAIGFLTAWWGTRDAKTSEPLTGPAPTLREQYRTVRANKPFVQLFLGYNLQAAATAAMLTGAVYVAKYVLGDTKKSTLLFVFLVAPCAVMVPLWRRYSTTRGKLRGYLLATAVFGVTGLSLVFAKVEPEVLIYVQMVLLGVGYAGMQLFPYAILPDLISEGNDNDGRSGIFTGVWQGGETVAFAVGPALYGLILAVTSYHSTTPGKFVSSQPDSAIAGLVVGFSLLPGLLTLASLPFLLRYKAIDDELSVRVLETA
ncbi:MAG: transporter [Frankiales bacterium]|nr:transporter [Frankiales bacterium]